MKAFNQVVGGLLRLALIFVIGMVAVAGAPTAPAAGSPAAQLELDFDLTNGVCTTIDSVASVPTDTEFDVAVCLTNYADPPVGGQITTAAISVYYDDTKLGRAADNVASELSVDLDANPDWNQSQGAPAGWGWDCNLLDDPASAPVAYATNPPWAWAGAPALIVCWTSDDNNHAMDSPLLAVLHLHAMAAGTNLPIRFGDIGDIVNGKATSIVTSGGNERVCGVDITCIGGQITVTGGPPVGPTPPSPTATNTPIPGVTPVSTPLPPGMEAVALVAGCSPVASTSPDGTPAQAIAGNVTPTGILSSIWKFDPATATWKGFSPSAPAAVNDLTEVDFLDAVFICANGPGTFVRPIV